jgi:hypothetical protein
MRAFLVDDVPASDCPKPDITPPDSKCKCVRVEHQPLPDFIATLIMLIPIMISKIAKIVSDDEMFFTWAFNFIAILAVIFILNVSVSLSAFLVVSPVTFMLMCECRRHKISISVMSEQLCESQIENERLEKENKASELKHLIGNVAHDLKTVRLSRQPLFPP